MRIQKIQQNEIVSTALFVRNRILFPHCTEKLTFVTRKGMQINTGDIVAVCPVFVITENMYFKNKIATRAEVVSVKNEPQKIEIELKGLDRVSLTKNVFSGELTVLPVHERESEYAADARNVLKKKAQEFVFLVDVQGSDRLIQLIDFIISLSQLSDFIAHYFVMDTVSRARVYVETDIVARARLMVTILDSLIKNISRQKERTVSYEKISYPR